MMNSILIAVLSVLFLLVLLRVKKMLKSSFGCCNVMRGRKSFDAPNLGDGDFSMEGAQ